MDDKLVVLFILTPVTHSIYKRHDCKNTTEAVKKWENEYRGFFATIAHESGGLIKNLSPRRRSGDNR